MKRRATLNYSIIKRNYDRGLWSVHNVKIAVEKGAITKEQYYEITGCIYPATVKEEGNGTDSN